MPRLLPAFLRQVIQDFSSFESHLRTKREKPREPETLALMSQGYKTNPESYRLWTSCYMSQINTCSYNAHSGDIPLRTRLLCYDEAQPTLGSHT